MDPMQEFLQKYGTHGASLLVRKFITLCPDFPEGMLLASELGQMCAMLEDALCHQSRTQEN